MVSRRDALKLSAAGLAGIRFANSVTPLAAESGDPSVWNWMGNAGHTGEFPGPGLDFSAPLGERWRVPEQWDSALSGHVQDRLLVTRRLDRGFYARAWRIEAIDSKDGSIIWSRNAPGYDSYAPGDSFASTPVPPSDGIPFSSRVVVHKNSIILTNANGQLRGIDTDTGEDLWNIDSGHKWIDPPTVVGDIAFSLASGGLCAIELGDTPSILWNADAKESNLRFLGVENNLVWIGGSKSISALDVQTGSEYWKTPINDLWESGFDGWYGIAAGLGLFQNGSADLLTSIDFNGSIAWSIDDTSHNDNQKVIVNNTISRFTPTSSNWETCRIECLSIEKGESQWSFDLATDRWTNTDSGYSVCEGVAYYSLYDQYEDEVVLLAIDPIEVNVLALGGTNLLPKLVTGGVMYARDRQTDELVCIGTVPGVLQSEGRAKPLSATTLYGAPNPSSANKGTVEADTVLTLAGNREETPDGDWWPVSDAASGLSGWLPADILEGLDGDIRFQPVDLEEFGHFIS